MKEKITIVTGAAGFIGSAYVWKLNSLGVNDIIVVDELDSSEKWRNLQPLSFLDYLHKDEFLRKVQDGKLGFQPSSIIHLGACSSTTERDANFIIENNYRYTKSIIEYCLKKKLRCIYASSAATYGDGSAGYTDDIGSLDRLAPLNLYGYSKQLLDKWVVQSGILNKVVGLKFFNVYGPNEYHKGPMRSVAVQAFEQIKKTGKVRLFKSYKDGFPDGGQKRDFVYVKDCVDVIHWFSKHPKKNGIFNLGSGKARTWNDLAQAVFAALNLPSNIEYIEMPQELKSQYQYYTEADLSNLRSVGVSYKFSTLESGVKDYVQNYLEKGSPYLMP